MITYTKMDLYIDIIYKNVYNYKCKGERGKRMTFKELMNAKGFTQYRLAQISGVRQSKLSRLCSGDVKFENISVGVAESLAKAFELSVDDLIYLLREGTKEDYLNMINFTIDDLREWNEEQDRDDTLYQVECRTYRKGQSGFNENTGDYFFAGSNDYDEAMKHYEYCKRMHANDNAIVKLTRAVQVYAGVLEYETIEKHSTFDESKINNEI